MLSKFFKLIFSFFVFLPIIVLLFYSRNESQVSFDHLFAVVLSSLNQAFLGASTALLLSIFIAPAYSRFSLRWRSYLDFFLVLPTFMPSLFVILAVLKMINPFPYGILGICLGYFFTYFGYGLVVLSKTYESKIQHFEMIQKIYKISHWKFAKFVYLPLIKNQSLRLFGILFLSCMTSLTIPMVLGGSKGINLELFIYQNLNNPKMSLSVAFIYFLQMAMYLLFLRTALVDTYTLPTTKKNDQNNIDKKWNFFVTIPLFYLLSIFSFIYLLFYYCYKNFDFLINEFAIVFDKLIYSAVLSLVVWIAFFVFLISYIYIYWKNNKVHFLYYLIAPSAAVVCYAYFLIFPLVNTIEVEFLKLLLIISTLMFPYYFKNFFLDKLELHKKQIMIAKMYNLSFISTIKNILWPVLQKDIFIIGLLIIFTCTFDFALFKAAGIQNHFMTTYLYDFISGYRLEQAYALSGISVLFIAVFVSLLRWTYVIIKKYSV